MKNPLIPKWVHSLADYRSMFDLDEAALNRSIAVFPSGISSFSAQMLQLGHHRVVSIDPFYNLSPMDMVKHVDFVIQEIAEELAEIDKAAESYVNTWNQIAQIFLSDYSVGQQEGRYCYGQMPHLPFENNQFELALCPDMIFREIPFLRENVVKELCRIAHEVRIFPLLNSNGEITEDLGALMLTLQQKNLGIELKEVPYQLIEKNNAMLRVWTKECSVTR